jgi:hypothetical protein
VSKDIRPIAIYLPQFHPVPENDLWWGKGFTEWTNVAKAKPLFDGHYQPHLPADLGFYDLRLAEVREEQAAMAKKYGIEGFCYYHYWFNGKRILERPFNEVLSSGKPDFPFMLCWANENWTKVWDGGENNILLEQKYSDEDDISHIKSLIPAFKDERYIKVDGKPVFAIYRSANIPDVKRTLETWRKEAKKEGLELYLCRMEGFGTWGESYLNDGFDAAISFEPFSKDLYDFLEKEKWGAIKNKSSLWYLKYKFLSGPKKEKNYCISWLNNRNTKITWTIKRKVFLPVIKFIHASLLCGITAPGENRIFSFLKIVLLPNILNGLMQK